jgi:hypothetical protein
MANSLRHRIGSLLLRHSPAPNLDQIHRLHRQAAGTLTSSGCKRFFSGGHDHDDIGRACEILHSFFCVSQESLRLKKHFITPLVILMYVGTSKHLIFAQLL